MTDREKIIQALAPLRASDTAVQEVWNMAQKERKTQRHPARTGLLIGLAAVLLIGSAFAAVSYKLHAERVGKLAVAVSVVEEGNSPGTVSFSGEAAENVSYTGLNVTPNWLPEGMTLYTGETTKWSYEDNWGRGGFSLIFQPLNAGNATFCEVVTDAVEQEELEINGHEALYVKSDRAGFNQRMFISYPEFNAVLGIAIGDDTDLATARRFAENLSVSAGDQKIDAENLKYNGKRYLDAANYIATGVYENTADGITAELMALDEAAWAERDPANRAARNNMADAHALNESFPVSFSEETRDEHFVGFTDLDVKVTDISVRDDYSALRDTQYLDMDWASRVDENGKLPKADYDFVVYGDGINTPGTTVVDTLPEQQLYMVAVTVEVTNNTDHTVQSTGYNGGLLSVAETSNGWEVTAPQPADATVEYDDGYCTGGGCLEEMRYWDLRAEGTNGGNYITDLDVGESVSFQMGFIVSECQLGDLWFCMNMYDIDASEDIHVGYVPVS